MRFVRAVLSALKSGGGASVAEDEPSQELRDYCWKRRTNTLYRAQVSALYHLKRERFFQVSDQAISFATAISATAAATVLIKKVEGLEIWISALTAFLALIPVVYNPAELARRHGQAASDYRKLLADAERTGEHWTTEHCNDYSARLLELEVAEPATLAALVVSCENQLKISLGDRSSQVHLPWWVRMLKQWIDFDPTGLVARDEKRKARLNKKG